MTSTRPSRAILPVIAIVAGLVLLAVGFATHRMWMHLPAKQFELSLVLALLVVGLAWPLRRFAGMPWAVGCVLVWLAALVVFAGPVAVIAAVVLALGAWGIGLWIVPDSIPARAAVALTAGLVVIAGLAGWVVTWPIHFLPVWYGALLAVIALRRHALRESISSTTTGLSRAIASAPGWSALAVMLLGLASTALWVPTMQVDDLAYHLNLPSQWLVHGQYLPDPSHQVWALAPWAGDVLQGITAVLAQDHARGPLNGLWMILAAGSAWSIAASLGATPVERWAGIVLMASFPPLVWMAAGLQTELPATAVTLALTATVAARSPRWVLAAAVLFAGLAALKTIHAFAAIPLGLWALWIHRSSLRGWHAPLALAVGFAIGGASYVQSWWIAGNPVLPLFNHVFQSPYYAVEAFEDLRWHAGFGPRTVWDMVFDTPRYVEAFHGGIGFTPVALAGAWLLALARPRTRGVALAATAVVLLPLLPVQYARYTYPGLALLSVLLVVGNGSVLGRRGFAVVVVGLCVLNLAFQASSGWVHNSVALKRTIRALGDPAPALEIYVPERLLIQRIPPDDDGVVLAADPERAYIAELGRRGRSVQHHNPTLMAARAHAEADSTGEGWQSLLENSGARWVLVVPATASPALQLGLQRVGATRRDSLRDAELWHVPGGDLSPDPDAAPGPRSSADTLQ